MSHKAVFIDRDDTLIDNSGYLGDPRGVRLLAGADGAIKSLRAGGYKIVVVTNQSGVARGMFSERALQQVHDEMRRQLADLGADVDGVYYCPYLPGAKVPEYSRASALRKPAPGMLLKAAAEMEIDLSASWMVGDSERDIAAGKEAGCKTVLVGQALPDADFGADYAVADLLEASRAILQNGTSAGVEQLSVPPAEPAPAPEPAPAAGPTDSDVLREMLILLRQLVRGGQVEQFSLSKLVGGMLQVLALLSLLIVFWKLLSPGVHTVEAIVWGVIAAVLQAMAITFFLLHQRR